MDLREVWKTLEEDKLNKPVLGAVKVRKTSRHPVQKLKNSYKITTAFAIIFLVGFIVLFFLFHDPLVKGSLLLVIASYVFFFVTNFSMYRNIQVELPVDQSLRTVLKTTHEFITSNIRFQERVSLFIYPIACTSGFLMGGSVGSGDLDKMLQQKSVWIALIVLPIVLTPLSYYLTKWMYKVSYGKCLSELKLLIKELERPE
jgi:hypothetical protein